MGSHRWNLEGLQIKRQANIGNKLNMGTPKWMVYNWKPYYNGWFGGTPIFGNIHMDTAPSPLIIRYVPSDIPLFTHTFPYSLSHHHPIIIFPIFSPIVWVTIIQYYLPMVQNSPACLLESLFGKKLLPLWNIPPEPINPPGLWFGNPFILVFWGIWQRMFLRDASRYPEACESLCAGDPMWGWPWLLEGRCKDRRARQIHCEFEVNLKWCGLVREL